MLATALYLAFAWASATTEIERLVSDLHSPDGRHRIAATKELLSLGRSILPELERAGAKPIQTVTPSRLDVVYSLIRGLPQDDYDSVSLGIRVEPKVTRAEVIRMGERRGFDLPRGERFDASSNPACYVRLRPGKTLAAVFRELLTEEPQVISVTPNFHLH